MSKRPSQHRAKALRAPARSRLGTSLIPEARPQRPARLQMHLGRRRHFARGICCTISTNLLLDMHREDSAPLCEASLQGAFRVNLQQQTRLQRLRPSGGDRDGCRTSARRALQALSRRRVSLINILPYLDPGVGRHKTARATLHTSGKKATNGGPLPYLPSNIFLAPQGKISRRSKENDFYHRNWGKGAACANFSRVYSPPLLSSANQDIGVHQR